MSKSKFTKGEWEGFIDGKWQSDDVNDYILDGDNNPSWIEIICNYEAVAIVPNHGNTLEANAHLIASAPEMYEMLESLREDYGLLTAVGKDIDSLLAKARGES